MCVYRFSAKADVFFSSRDSFKSNYSNLHINSLSRSHLMCVMVVHSWLNLGLCGISFIVTLFCHIQAKS